MKQGRSVDQALLSWFLMIILSLIWGSSFILMKKGLLNFRPAQVAGIRITSAFLFLLPIAIKNMASIRTRHLKYLFASGVLGSLIPAFLFATAQTRIESSISGVMNGLTPLFTILVGMFFYKLEFSPRSLIGVIIGFIGTFILITAGNPGNDWKVDAYALLIVLATLFYGFNVNIVNFRLGDLKSSHITSFSMLLVGPIALSYLIVNAGIPGILRSSPTAIYSLLAVITLGVFGTAVAYILFNKMIKITNPVFSSSVTYLIPIVAILWGLLDGEKLNGQHFLGVLFIIAGVFIARRIKK